MTTDQWLVIAVLLAVVGLLMWGRWRYDVVAFSALIVAVAVGVVPSAQASGIRRPSSSRSC